MPELMRESVGLPSIGRWRRGDRNVALKHKLMLGVIGAMLGALLQGCTAGKQPSQEETSLANAAKDVTIPLEAGKMKNPLPETDEIVSQGQEVFLGSCAQCHGPEARGGTNVGRNMNPPAMDLTSAHVQHWSDAELFWIIQNGVRLTGLPGSRASLVTTPGSLHATSTTFPDSTLPPAPQQARHRHKPPLLRRTSTPSKYRMASRSPSSEDTKAGR
jgi:mono/diheme cytochrome c family protein